MLGRKYTVQNISFDPFMAFPYMNDIVIDKINGSQFVIN